MYEIIDMKGSFPYYVLILFSYYLIFLSSSFSSSIYFCSYFQCSLGDVYEVQLLDCVCNYGLQRRREYHRGNIRSQRLSNQRSSRIARFKQVTTTNKIHSDSRIQSDDRVCQITFILSHSQRFLILTLFWHSDAYVSVYFCTFCLHLLLLFILLCPKSFNCLIPRHAYQE